VELAFEVQGSGPLLVLVHGITENRRSWDPLLAALAAAHTVVAVDLRGHGESGPGQQYDVGAMAGDVDELLDELGLTAPLLVGHSLGGVVVTAFAAAFACRGVVNIDQPLALGGFQDGVRQLEGLLRGTTDEFRSAVGGIFEQMVGPLPPAERERIEALRRPDQDVVLGVWTMLLEASRVEVDAFVISILEHVRVPYLSLHGIDIGDEYAPWLRTMVPGVEVEVWSGTGHYPHLVHPNEFLARLAAFEAALGS
jgi:pimeloyl-ACP methyl ester carboxylesterase